MNVKFLYLIRISFIVFLLYSCSGNKEKFLIEEAARGNKLYQSNLQEKDSGDEYEVEIFSEIVTTPQNSSENVLKYNELNALVDRIDKINTSTSELILGIDKIKCMLLDESKEDMSFSGKKDQQHIVWSQYDYKDPLLPVQLNLSAVKNKDNMDLVEAKFIQKKLLWKKYNEYRMKLVNYLGSYEMDGETYTMNAGKINNYVNQGNLLMKTKTMVRSNAINPSDENALIEIYMLLTKQEVNDDGTFWYEANFTNNSLVTTINRLSLIQNEILKARKLAMRHISRNTMQTILGKYRLKTS